MFYFILIKLYFDEKHLEKGLNRAELEGGRGKGVNFLGPFFIKSALSVQY